MKIETNNFGLVQKNNLDKKSSINFIFRINLLQKVKGKNPG